MERSGGAPPKDAPIDWPDISTKQHQHHLAHQQLGSKDGSLFTIANALTDRECSALVWAVEDAGGFDWQGSRGPSKGEAVRDCGRVSRRGRSEEALVARLWKRLAPAITSGLPPRDAERAVGLNPHVRVYAYAPGQKFSRHYDDSEAMPPEAGEQQQQKHHQQQKHQQQQQQQQQKQKQQQQRGGEKRWTGYTLLIYLSTLRGASPGGETKFYSDGGRLVASVVPAAGTALLHRHGDRCLLHEGARVEKGPPGSETVKYVFRTDVVFQCAWWS